MTIHIVTDSTADLPEDLVRDLDITVVPLNVHFGDETLRDTLDIQPEEFYGRLVTSHRLPTTSQPSPGAFLEVYSRLTEGDDQVVSIHVSGLLSRTINSAEVARGQMPNGGSVELVDTGLASMAAGLAVLAAAQAAQSGGTVGQIVEIARNTAKATKFFVMVETLEYLQKGGRIGKAQALVGTLLRIKPILTLDGGEIHPWERTRTRRKALDRLHQVAGELAPFASASVAYSTTLDDAEELRDRLVSLGDGNVILTRIGPVVGTHIGPGAVGFAVECR